MIYLVTGFRVGSFLLLVFDCLHVQQNQLNAVNNNYQSTHMGVGVTLFICILTYFHLFGPSLLIKLLQVLEELLKFPL